ncbi:hypothetical protein Baya_3874 [Bagarius yarrelli]|uniref:Uncharacterized protein n=1 Tax=Bagarius yarrelli TaxID=175774 RepID=A0A556TWT7_BAGYA|nr:hypothetical protein Baya_3874 [Bagarius yarrelli]
MEATTRDLIEEGKSEGPKNPSERGFDASKAGKGKITSFYLVNEPAMSRRRYFTTPPPVVPQCRVFHRASTIMLAQTRFNQSVGPTTAADVLGTQHHQQPAFLQAGPVL